MTLTEENSAVLQDLLRRVESATGADRELDEAILLACGYAPDVRVSDIDGHVWERWTTPDGEVQHQQRPALTASLDAALALAERCDPGFKWRVAAYTPAEAQACGIDRAERPFWATCGLPGEQEQAAGKTPALALLAALLKALAAGQSLTGKSVDGSTPQTPESPQ